MVTRLACIRPHGRICYTTSLTLPCRQLGYQALEYLCRDLYEGRSYSPNVCKKGFPPSLHSSLFLSLSLSARKPSHPGSSRHLLDVGVQLALQLLTVHVVPLGHRGHLGATRHWIGYLMGIRGSLISTGSVVVVVGTVPVEVEVEMAGSVAVAVICCRAQWRSGTAVEAPSSTGCTGSVV